MVLSPDPGCIVQTHRELFKPTLRPHPRPLNQNSEPGGGGAQASLSGASEWPGSSPPGPDGGEEEVGVEKGRLQSRAQGGE